MSAVAVRITYCTQCNWLLRASWLASEILATFGAELSEVTLVPGTGGIFTITVATGKGAGAVTIWDRAARKAEGLSSFPDAATLKRLVRDTAFTERELGHLDA